MIPFGSCGVSVRHFPPRLPRVSEKLSSPRRSFRHNFLESAVFFSERKGGRDYHEAVQELAAMTDDASEELQRLLDRMGQGDEAARRELLHRAVGRLRR